MGPSQKGSAQHLWNLVENGKWSRLVISRYEYLEIPAITEIWELSWTIHLIQLLNDGNVMARDISDCWNTFLTELKPEW